MLLQKHDFRYSNSHRPWSSTEQRSKLKAFVGGTPDSWAETEWKTYSKAFLWKDDGPDAEGSYKFPVAEVNREKLTYSPKAIKSAISAIKGLTPTAGSLYEAKEPLLKMATELLEGCSGDAGEAPIDLYDQGFFEVDDFEVKADSDDKYPNGIVEGYGSTFGNIDRHRHKVMPGAFAKTIKETKGKVFFMDSHRLMSFFGDNGLEAIIGQTFHMEEDKKGLFFKAFFSATPTAQNIRTQIKEGLVTKLSMGYRPIKTTDRFEDKEPHMELNEVQLVEISAVAIPANEKAVIRRVKSDRTLGFEPDIFPDFEREFDSELAMQRWITFCGKGAPFSMWSPDQVLLFSKGFAAYDQNAATLADAFRGLLVDVVNDTPFFVKAAIYKAKDVSDRSAELIQQFGLDARNSDTSNIKSESQGTPSPLTSVTEPADATPDPLKKHFLQTVEDAKALLAKQELMQVLR